MIFNRNLKNIFLVIFATLILSACSTAKKSGNVDGDVYTGKETVKFLASGVPDRVFFATNKSSLTTKSRETLRKQAKYLRKNKNLNVTIEGHADERGSRAFNLALGEKRADAVKEIFLLNNISDTRIETVSYGEEKPVVDAYSEESHSLNRRVELKFKK